MADDPKKLAAAQKIANEAIKEGKNLTKELGSLLDKQIKSAGKYNAVIENRAKVLNSIAKADKSSIPNLRGMFVTKLRMFQTEKKMAEVQKKYFGANKQFGQSLIDNYQIDLDGLEANKEKLTLDGMRKEATAGINKTMLTGVGIITSLVAVTIKFGQKIDEIGNAFGSLNVLGSEFQDTLISQGNSVTALGFGVQDVANVTNTLASNFGMNVDEASKLSGKVLDTGKALGLSADEASNLFGTLMTVGGLTAKQTEELTEGAFQLARQAGVAPQQVMKDIAGSAETVATFTKDGGRNLLEAAISARQLGISIDSVAKSARGVLNFEESIGKEMTASVLTGTRLDLQRARQLSLNKDIAGFEQEIRKQIELQGDFGAMSVFQQEALADAIGMSVPEVSRISKGLEDVSIKGALAASSFEDLVGRDSMSNISSLIGSFKQLGAILTDALGKGLEDSVGGLKDFLGNTDNVNKLKASFTEIGQKLGEMVTSLSEFLTNSGGITAMASGVMAFANGISKAVSLLPLLVAGLVVAKGAAISLSIATSLAALTQSATIGGVFGVVATIGAIVAGVATLNALSGKAQTGITGFSGGNLMVGESGPEIMNVPRGTNVTGAETTRQIMGGNQNFGKIENALNRLVSLQQVNNEQQGNIKLTAGRGELRVGLEPALGGTL
tara:strand:+ start:455 stop:2464 length:2010 start_codon:yes stop_codon:yes gene_type:complete